MPQKPWVDDVVSAFVELGGTAHLSSVYDHIERHRTDLSRTWKGTVRRTIENHSSDSEAFLDKENLFYKIGELGSGMWGLRGFKK